MSLDSLLESGSLILRRFNAWTNTKIQKHIREFYERDLFRYHLQQQKNP